MTSLDARALTSDREGLAFLRAVIGASADLPSVESRFGVPAALVASPKRRREPSSPVTPRVGKRAVRAAS